MSKWVLINVENGTINMPETFDTYEKAYKQMEREYYEVADDEYYECNIHEDYASIQAESFNSDWRIYEVKM